MDALFHIEKLATVSTLNVPPQELSAVTQDILDGKVPGWAHDEGILLRTMNLLEAYPYLTYLLGYLWAHGCFWVSLEPDADTCDELPLFDHDSQG